MVGSQDRALRSVPGGYSRSDSPARPLCRSHHRRRVAQLCRPRSLLSRSGKNTPALDDWFASFYRRYPPPPNEARDLSPAILAEISPLFRMRTQRQFEIAIPLTPAFYLDYMMTETNVAAAIRSGGPPAEIKSWCAGTLAPVWSDAEREVLFRGYFACLAAA